MSMPAKSKIYNYTVNQLITYVSLIDTLQRYVYGIKTALLASGCTLVWSASAGTGPANASDHTDRVTTPGAFAPRAAVAAASQGWFVILDGNGAQWLFAYQGATDDVCRISYSAGALFTLAGTTNQQPTAVDEEVIASATSVIGATASANRVWHGHVSTDGKQWRFWIHRQSTMQSMIRCELISPVTLPVGVTWSVPIVGMFHTTNSSGVNAIAADSGVTSKTRAVSASISTDVSVVHGIMTYGGSASLWGAVQLDTVGTPGSPGYPLYPLGVGGNTAGVRGPLGNHIDYYMGRTSGTTDGDPSDTLAWVYVGAMVLPWDGLSSMQIL